jgi:hypothetical protein
MEAAAERRRKGGSGIESKGRRRKGICREKAGKERRE